MRSDKKETNINIEMEIKSQIFVVSYLEQIITG